MRCKKYSTCPCRFLESRRADSNRLPLLQLRVIGQWLQGFANPAYLEGFLFPGLPSVAPYCVPGGIRVVSTEAWLLHDPARSWHASEVRLVSREERKYLAYPRPLLALDTQHGKARCRRYGRGRGIGATQAGIAVRSRPFSPSIRRASSGVAISSESSLRIRAIFSTCCALLSASTPRAR